MFLQVSLGLPWVSLGFPWVSLRFPCIFVAWVSAALDDKPLGLLLCFCSFVSLGVFLVFAGASLRWV